LFVHSGDEGYGADRVLLSMIQGCLRFGRPVLVLIPDDSPPGWLTEQLHQLEVDTIKCPLAPARRKYFKPQNLATYIRDLWRARGLVRRYAEQLDARVIHINTTAMLVGALVGRPNRAKLVWHVHEIVLRPAPVAWIFRRIPGCADRVVVVSDAVRANLRLSSRARERVRRIYNGIAPRNPAPATGLGLKGSPVVAYVGRLSAWKGYSVFVDAIARLAGDFPDARFVIAGDPPPGEEWRAEALREKLDSSGLASQTSLLGFYPDAPALFDLAEIVAVPSVLPDPLPTVVLEAMRALCAVVASNTGGAPEMIQHNQSGLLVPPGDAGALSGALRILIQDEELRGRIGAAAEQRVSMMFTVEAFQDQIEDVYRELEA
jgi:glycosyltransferase involved in cell wall biosynthesis